MNAGIRERAIADVLKEIVVIDPRNGLTALSPQQCGFGYRQSAVLQQRLPVLWGRLRLDGDPFDRTEILDRRRRTQPVNAYSAGCIFRNPQGFSAGYLIQKAGLKGLSCGGAKVSDKHANFIVNAGGATSAEIRKLIDIVRQKVYKSLRILLELEIEVLYG